MKQNIVIGSKVLPNHCGKGACLPSPPCRRCFPSPLPLLLSCLFITLFLLDVIPLCLSSVPLWKSQHMADLHTSRRRLTEPTMVCTCQTLPPFTFVRVCTNCVPVWFALHYIATQVTSESGARGPWSDFKLTALTCTWSTGM